MSAILSGPHYVNITTYTISSICQYKEVAYFFHVYHSSQFMITGRALVLNSLVKNKILITNDIHSF